MKRLSNLLATILALIGGAIALGFVTRLVLRAVIEAVDHVDEIAQRQAARHAYGPLVAVPREPRDGEAIDMQYDADVTSQDDELSRHRYAPGKRPWDDDVLSQYADPLAFTIDDPFAETGEAQPLMQPLGSPIVYEDRGGGMTTEV